MNQMILAIDPGREKCGIAVVHKQNGVVMQQVINTKDLTTMVRKLIVDYNITTVVIGDRTSSREAKNTLEQIKIDGYPFAVALVDEHHSTDQARSRYWLDNPPRGFKRLIPVTMQVPTRPVDDYVAVILAERYFAKH